MTNQVPQIKTVRLGDVDYPIDQLSADGRATLNNYSQIETHLLHLRNLQAVLTKARNAYIEDLKFEIMQARTGLDFDMFSDD